MMAGGGGTMSVLNSMQYWAKRVTIGLWGPAELDEAHDPREALKEEYDAEGGDNGGSATG